MRNLRESGDKSFEELIARLLSRLSGERIRRCKAGTQGGVDAIAEIPFGIEDKRYAKQVRGRELEGGLTDAAGTYPGLQLWVLVATCAVGAQPREALVSAGLRQGIAVLVLDATMSELDLPGVFSLAALAATDIDTTIDVLADPTWRKRGRKPNLDTIRDELEAIRSLPSFGAWEARLRKDLRELPTWRYLVRSQNERLHSLIVGDAANAFGTPYDPAQAISRSAEADLTAWWRSCTTAGTADVAVVTGDRYDGKTWLVYRWLSESLRNFSVPVFFFSSYQVQSAHGDLEALVFQEARRALGRFERHTNDIVDRQKSRAAGVGPWCIVILDGANEYVAAPEARAAAVLWAVPPTVERLTQIDDSGAGNLTNGPQTEDWPTSDKRRCALLMTCRARDFEDDSSWLGSRPTHRVKLGAYNDQEFLEALKRRAFDPERLAHLPQSTLQMIRRPRYLDLMIRHYEELGFAGVTSDVLHYLDASDKVRSRTSTAVGWDADAFKEFLAKLAVTWAHERKLNHATLLSHVRAVTERVGQSLAALLSEGVIARHPDGTFVPDIERLALGMGLFIRGELLSMPLGADLPGALGDILEPHRDDDEKVRWLRAGVATSVLAGDVVHHPRIVECLISAWLSSRNFSQEDLEDLKSLSPLLTEPVLQLISSLQPGNGNVLLLAEPIIHGGMDRHESAIAEAVRRWLRFVPTGTRWVTGWEAQASADVAQAASEPSFNDLQLHTADGASDESVRERQRLGLSLAYTRPSLIRPVDVLALLATRNAVHGYLDKGERFAVRRILSDSNRAWYEEEIRSWRMQPEAPRTMLLGELISDADRGDLLDLTKELPEPPHLSWGRTPLTRVDLRALKNSGDISQVMPVAARAQNLALDPSCPRPSLSWRAALGKVANTRFAGSVTLHAFNCTSKDDFDLEEVEPALAAWAPDAGARIWRAFLTDIPRRIAADEESWSWEIEGHAALLTRADHQTLLHVVLDVNAKKSELQHALQRAYLCVLAGASSSERLRLLLEHPFDSDWTGFYEVLGAAGDAVLRRHTSAAVRLERNPERLKRARYLLGYLGGADLSAPELARLVGDLSNEGSGEDAPHFLLRHSRVMNSTSPDALGPLVSVARSLHDVAWQYEAFVDRKRRPDVRGAIWVAWALSAPRTARSNGAEEGVSDEVAVAQGIHQLALKIQEILGALDTTPTMRWEQFPDGIAGEISEHEFNAWVDLLLASPIRARHFCLGLLVPVVRRALRTRHPRAKELWALAYPFQRGQSSPGGRIVVEGGLDWALREIHDPEIKSDLAGEILRELIADCRSDSELVEVTMAARLESMSRLTEVVEDGLTSTDQLDRAKARFVAGWMPESSALRSRLAAADPSGWVERIGEQAIRRLDRERWAREWLRRFLAETRRARRWAAGRLFLECSDAATPFWAAEVIWESGAPATRRAEAQLLVRKIRKKTDDSDLRDNFLGYPVRELSAVVPPWRRVVRWDDIRVTRSAEEA